jgi:DNA-binding CsgD family transcriptional regulator
MAAKTKQARIREPEAALRLDDGQALPLPDVQTVALEAAGLGVCVKDHYGRVLYQNFPCLRACGNRQGTVCADGCMGYYQPSKTCEAFTRGAQIFSGITVGTETYDAVLVSSETALTTLLCPVGSRESEALAFLSRYGLSRRELEILELVAAGETNAAITRRLCISRPTLKTHLNNAYKKLPPEAGEDIKRLLRSKKATRPLEKRAARRGGESETALPDKQSGPTSLQRGELPKDLSSP